MSPRPNVRSCLREDMAEVREIYALEVREGTASFELEPPSLSEMTERFAAIEAAGLPYLVAALDDRIAGYAYAAPYRPRPAYRHTVEDSVYVARWARRQGVGRALLAALIERASARGMRQMVAIIGDSAHSLDPAAREGRIPPGRHPRERRLEVRSLAGHRGHAASARSRRRHACTGGAARCGSGVGAGDR